MSVCRCGAARQRAADEGRDPGRVRVHHCSAAHAALVESYRAARAAWEDQHETVALGYRAEQAQHRQDVPPPTFGDWLRGTAASA